MKKLRSVSLTEQEFYEAVRSYVFEELNMHMPPDLSSVTMRESQEDRTMVLEWEDGDHSLKS